jgi:hypothetical protein
VDYLFLVPLYKVRDTLLNAHGQANKIAVKHIYRYRGVINQPINAYNYGNYQKL